MGGATPQSRLTYLWPIAQAISPAQSEVLDNPQHAVLRPHEHDYQVQCYSFLHYIKLPAL